MFEHMKGYPALFAKCASWLRDGGKMFVHVFVHRDTPYEFEEGDGWMAKVSCEGVGRRLEDREGELQSG
jgi:cyclopropane fatty-acyl-phospholipid synthase-like methyltransferase